MLINYEEIRRMADNIRAMVGDDEDCFLTRSTVRRMQWMSWANLSRNARNKGKRGSSESPGQNLPGSSGTTE